MDEYIEREALIHWLTKPKGFKRNCVGCLSSNCLDCVIDEITYAPAADVVEVVHAEWIRYHEADFGWDEWGYRCSNCEWEVEDRDIKFPMNFCPCCGAKMDVERKAE